MESPVVVAALRPGASEPPGPHIRLPLYAELYLVAHDAFDGTPLLHRAQLGAGLAAAVLLDLWFTRYIAITPDGHRTSHALPQLVPLGGPWPVDPVIRAALDGIHGLPPGPDRVRGFVSGSAESLHATVGTALLEVGVLHRTTSRRLGLFPTHTILPAGQAWAVRATARIRDAITGRVSADARCAALGALLACLDLTDVLHADLPEAQLRPWLHQLAVGRYPEIGVVLAVLDAVRGDLAVTALR